MRKNQGFTAIELLITIALMAIVLAIVTPSLVSFVNSNKLSATSNDFLAAVSTARVEAIKKRALTTMEKNGASWANGWQVTQGTGTSKIVLLTGEAVASGITIGTSSSNGAIIFNSSGYSKSNHLGSNGVVFCDEKKQGRKVDLMPSGSVSITKVTCS